MRLAVGLFIALLVNVGLFSLMQQMTATKDSKRLVTENIRLLDFVRVKKDEPLEVKKRQLPKKPPPPSKKPPPPKTPPPQKTKPRAPNAKLNVPNIAIPLNMAGGPYLGDHAVDAPAPKAPAIDGEVVPLVRSEPRYPRAAARRGIEGVVTILFTITKDGRVRDPIVTSATPEGVFNQSAIRAILKWKFRPKMVDGEPVERQATQKIEFVLRK